MLAGLKARLAKLCPIVSAIYPYSDSKNAIYPYSDSKIDSYFSNSWQNDQMIVKEVWSNHFPQLSGCTADAVGLETKPLQTCAVHGVDDLAVCVCATSVLKASKVCGVSIKRGGFSGSINNTFMADSLAGLG